MHSCGDLDDNALSEFTIDVTYDYIATTWREVYRAMCGIVGPHFEQEEYLIRKRKGSNLDNLSLLISTFTQS